MSNFPTGVYAKRSYNVLKTGKRGHIGNGCRSFIKMPNQFASDVFT